MFKLDLTEGDFPIILKPNLGQPTLINIREFTDNNGTLIKKIVFEAYIIVIPTQGIEEILNFFHLNLYIQPILKDKGTFSERRGELYPLQVQEISKINKLDFRDQAILKEEDCIIWDIFDTLLQIDNIFGKRSDLYKIKIQIKEINKIFQILEENNQSFLLFDIVHDVPNRIENKVNYHAIALFNKDWSDFKFIHATDFHIARRNDFISKFLKDKAKDKKNNP